MIESIRTERLLLIPADADLINAELAGVDVLASALEASVGDTWSSLTMTNILPLFAKQLDANPELVGWFTWYWVLARDDGRVLIGNGGFKGPPDDAGQVEIGYEVLPAHQGHGYATETVATLAKWALRCADVETVVAECLPDNFASIRVLEKCGFVEVGDGLEQGSRLWRTSAVISSHSP